MSDQIINTELIDAMAAIKANNTKESQEALLQAAFKATVYVPTNTQEVKGELISVPVVVNTDDGRLFQPVFTDEEHIDMRIKDNKSHISQMQFAKVSAIVSRQNELMNGMKNGKGVAGIVINPTFEAVVIPTEVISAVVSKMATANMSEEQYLLYERVRFEQFILPGSFFAKGEEFLASLLTGKEKFIDDMCKLAFARKDIYPYSMHEFTVSAMRPAENLMIVKVDMPYNNSKLGTAEFVMMVAVKDTDNYRFFAVVKEPGEDEKSVKRSIVEITADNKSTRISDAPEEGTEINWLMEYIK